MNKIELIGFIRTLADGYILHPDQLVIELVDVPGASEKFVRLDAEATDKARLIGRNGKHFRALGTLVSMFAKQRGEKVRLLHLDLPAQPERGDRYPKFKIDSEWPIEQMRAIVERTVNNCLDTAHVWVEIVQLTKADSAIAIHVSPQRDGGKSMRDFKEAAEVLFGAITTGMGQRVSVSVVDDLNSLNQTPRP